MKNLEKDLKSLSFARPPKWLRARTLIAAQNAYAEVARKRRRRTFLIAAVAAVALFTVMAHFLASAIGLFGYGNRRNGFRATPFSPFAPGLSEPDDDASGRELIERRKREKRERERLAEEEKKKKEATEEKPRPESKQEVRD